MANTLLGKYLVKRREEQFPKLKEAFAVFDKENTGFIKCEDLGNVMRSIGENPTDDELKDAIDALDVYRNGFIEFSKFLNFMAHTLRDDSIEEYLKLAFKIFDKDQDGFISAAEIIDATASRPRAVTDEEAKSIVKRADLDGDGKLSYEDFKKMMLRKCFKLGSSHDL